MVLRDVIAAVREDADALLQTPAYANGGMASRASIRARREERLSVACMLERKFSEQLEAPVRTLTRST